jgi:hypothetical protein
MIRKKEIEVTLTQDRLGKALVVVRESPLSYLDVELYPHRLREIATVLVKIADEAEAGGVPQGKRTYQVGSNNEGVR